MNDVVTFLLVTYIMVAGLVYGYSVGVLRKRYQGQTLRLVLAYIFGLPVSVFWPVFLVMAARRK